jgi:hypothetical protein
MSPEIDESSFSLLLVRRFDTCVVMNESIDCEGIPGAMDAAESNAIIAVLTWRFPFRVHCADEPRPAVYGRPRRHRTEIFVYGDYSVTERSQICAATALTVKQLQTKPIDLYFYPRELENEDLVEHHRFGKPSA